MAMSKTSGKKTTTPAFGADAREFMALVLWARKHGIAVAYLEVGDVKANLSDPAALGNFETPTKPSMASLARDYGGESFAAVFDTSEDES